MKYVRLTAAFAAFSLAALLSGCDIESAENSYNEVDINVEGYYANSGGLLVQKNTGNPIASMNIRQNGDGLEGVDNNGNLFKGTIGQVIDGTTASFNLTGPTTAGNEGTISGNFAVTSGDSVKMSGTWIEAAFYSTVYGSATVPNSTNSNDSTQYTLTANVNPAGFGTVSGGGSYASGSPVSLTATAAAGHTFSSWSGADSSSGATASVTMNGNRTVTANFN